MSPFVFLSFGGCAGADVAGSWPCEGRYPYVSHLVCNAGVAPFSGISWTLYLQQFWRDMLELNPLGVMTDPTYNVQRRGVMSDDGLGWTWQCNVFGHYILVRTSVYFTLGKKLTTPLSPSLACCVKCRALEAKLAASRTGPGRVLWMSSSTARTHTYDANDWQLVDTPRPYEGSKFQMDLIRAELSRRAGPSAPIRHFTVHPGAVDSSISAALESGITTYLKIFTFYLVRFIYSCLLCYIWILN